MRTNLIKILHFIVLYVITDQLLESVTAAPIVREGNFELIILHNNDMHARFDQTNALSGVCTAQNAANNACYGGFARVAHIVRKYKNESNNVLFLNAGDTYTGTPWFTLYKDKIASEFMNILKPDAISLGNHEFDNGVDGLVPFLNAIDMPVLAANLDLSKEPTLAAAAALKNSSVFSVNGNRVGVIGYLTPETKHLAAVNNVEYIPEIEAINEEAAKLKAQGVNIIIALGHSGLDEDRIIAANCPDIDLLIGGHSHTFLYSGDQPDKEVPAAPYPVEVKQASGKIVPVVQAYAFTKYLGYLQLTFDANGNLLDWNGHPILLNASVPQDPDVLATLKKYRPGIDALENTVIGVTKVILDGDCRKRECNLGNFIADAMVYQYASNYSDSNGYWTDAPIAILQGGGIRSSIDASSVNGNITKFDLSTIMPFGNSLLAVTSTGKQLKEALEMSVHRYSEDVGYGEFLQMSGIHVTYNLNAKPGSRVSHVKVLCGRCRVPNFYELRETDTFKILMSNFLFEGGDNFTMFRENEHVVLEQPELDVLENFVTKFSPIYPPVEWRITFDNQDDTSTPDSAPGATNISMGVLLFAIFVQFVKSHLF